MEVIAVIHTDFPTKFGLPRQSGLVEALHGLTLYLNRSTAIPTRCGAWRISPISGSSGSFPRQCGRTGPPRCGRRGWAATRRMGVFATRSAPSGPMPIGLSCVRLEGVEHGTPDLGQRCCTWRGPI